MGKIETNWSYKEFLAFFLICAANADLEVNREEKDLILSKVDKDVYKRMKKQFDKNSDYECLQIIQSYKGKFFSTHEDSKKLYMDMINLLLADEEYSKMEKAFFTLLKKTMG